MKESTRFCLIAASGLAMLSSVNTASAQDIHFSQFFNCPLQLNPALTGAFNGDMRGVVIYKDQWRSVSAASPYKTVSASFDMRMMQKKWKMGYMGVGLSFYNDRAGASKMGTNQINISIASSRDIAGGNSVAVGLQGGFAQKSMTGADLKWDDEYNPVTGQVVPHSTHEPLMQTNPGMGYSPNFTFGDFSGGILWNYGKAQAYSTANNTIKAKAGFAMFHVNNPNQSFYKDSRGGPDKLFAKYIAHATIIWGVKNTPLSVMPGFMMALQGPSKEILVGGTIRYTLSENSKYTGNIKESALSLGAYFRTQDAFIAIAEFEIANYAIGVSYDVNAFSSLRTASSGLGGTEICLKYINPNPFRNKSSARF